jgi:Uma2 family endonuclease
MSTEATIKMVQERPNLAWEVPPLLPEQGQWSVEEYLWLTNHTNRLVEFSDGYIEVLPMPADRHQAILAYLFLRFNAWAERIGGKVRFAALRVRISARKFREPDLVFLLSADDSRRQDAYWEGADLVVEVVSPDDPKRDLVNKRREYAQAGIPEYWIAHPQSETIIVLRLSGKTYAEHGEFKRGETATSVLLEGFSVGVDAALDAK